MLRNILIITESKGYIALSLQEKLQRKDYEVIVSSSNVDEIASTTVELSAIIFYCDEVLIAEHRGIMYAKDKALQEDIPMFVIGTPEEIGVIQTKISRHLVQKFMERPIDMNDVVKEIDDYVRNTGDKKKKKILVVDDSGATLRSVKKWLEDKYTVILANSGAMAIKYLALNKPDLVLLDYEMPIVDGKQVIQMIRTENEFADIPVMFLTNKSDKDSVMEVIPFKPVGYLSKATEPQVIVNAIDNFFVQQRLGE